VVRRQRRWRADLMFRGVVFPLFFLFAAIACAEAQSLPEWVPIPDGDGGKPEILNGRPAERSAWPVTLQFQSAGAYCTGTIVGDQVLLTAAHCVDNGAKARVLFNNAWTDVTCVHHSSYKGPSCLTATTVGEIAGGIVPAAVELGKEALPTLSR